MSVSALSNGAAADGEAAEGAELGMGLFNEEEDSNWQGPQPTKPSRTHAPQMWGSYGSSARAQQVKKGSGQTRAICDMHENLILHWHEVSCLRGQLNGCLLKSAPAQLPLMHAAICFRSHTYRKHRRSSRCTDKTSELFYNGCYEFLGRF